MLRFFCSLALFLAIGFSTSAQDYVPFPTDSASWNQLYQSSYFPGDNYIRNYTYQLGGDTLINDIGYKKVFFRYSDPFEENFEFIGGLREDNFKNIYFYASATGNQNVSFPELETEFLIYTFDNLEIGTTLQIGSEWDQFIVTSIDSVLVGESYRKRYGIDQQSMLDPYQYWIEGIGSNKDLLSVFASEFEWTLSSVCYSDNLVDTYLFEPFDTCYIEQSNSILENNSINFKLFPNPVNDLFTIESDHYFHNGSIKFFNAQGEMVREELFDGYKEQLGSSVLKPGFHFLEISDNEQSVRARILKE